MRRPRSAPARAPMRSALAILLMGGAAIVQGCGEGGARDGGARLSLSETLAGGDTAGYERATEVRDFAFPEDHGPHPGFRTEWWYVTGNLADADDRAFGFQFTLFRSALAPEAPDVASDWATNQAYMGHFTLTDVQTGGFRAFERFARGAGWRAR